MLSAAAARQLLLLLLLLVTHQLAVPHAIAWLMPAVYWQRCYHSIISSSTCSAKPANGA
jgi:hypothetical protein